MGEIIKFQNNLKTEPENFQKAKYKKKNIIRIISIIVTICGLLGISILGLMSLT